MLLLLLNRVTCLHSSLHHCQTPNTRGLICCLVVVVAAAVQRGVVCFLCESETMCVCVCLGVRRSRWVVHMLRSEAPLRPKKLLGSVNTHCGKSKHSQHAIQAHRGVLGDSRRTGCEGEVCMCVCVFVLAKRVKQQSGSRAEMENIDFNWGKIQVCVCFHVIGIAIGLSGQVNNLKIVYLRVLLR